MSRKQISERIFASRNGSRVEINIYPRKDKQKLLMLKLWVFIWTILGGIVVTQLFLDYAGQEKLFMVIYLALWGFFEYKTVHALRYNINGKEQLVFEDGKMSYVALIGERGIPKYYNQEELSNFEYKQETEKGFLAELQNSYWFVGGESIEFVSGLGVRRFGMKLNESESKQLIKYINSYLKIK
jgi:hypothetical protein